jgi:hydroxymethylglutaryl-CoA lyase
VATEDVLYLLHGMGVQTGVDLDAVVDASLLVETALGTPLPSRVLRARIAERQRNRSK